MALRQIELPWSTQPQEAASARAGVARILIGSMPAAGMSPPASLGADGRRVGPWGVSRDYTGGGNGSSRFTSLGADLSGGMALVAIAAPDSLSSEVSVCGVSSAGSSGPWIRIEYRPDLSSGTWNLQYGAGSYTNVNGGAASVGRADVLVAVWRPGTAEKSLWVNGVKTSSGTTDQGVPAVNQFEIGNLWRTSPVQHFAGAIPLAALLSYAPTDDECRAIAANAYAALLEPQRIWVPVSASGAASAAVDQALGSPSSSATAVAVVAAAVAQAVPAASQAATAGAVAQATVAQSVPAPAQAATATVGAAAASAVVSQALAPAAQSAASGVIVAAGVSQSVAAAGQAATVAATVSASAAQSVAAPSQSATATVGDTRNATAAQTLAMPSMSAAAAAVVQAGTIQVLQAPASSVLARVVGQAQAAQLLAAASQSASASAAGSDELYPLSGIQQTYPLGGRYQAFPLAGATQSYPLS